MSRLAAGQANGFWYNSRSGRWYLSGEDDAVKQPFASGIPSGPGTSDRYYNPPGKPADGNDWVLVLEVQ